MLGSILALGCSSAGQDEAAGLTAGADDGPYDPIPGDSRGDDDDGQAGTDSGADDDGGEDDGMRLDLGNAEPPPDPGGSFHDCPAAAPKAWILCEDFEGLDDPADVALDYQGLDGAFVLVDNVGASGDHAMQVTYREGEPEAGRMVLSFGASPIDHGERPSHAPDASFSEVYWRVRVMTEPGWPDLGPGQLTRTVAFADETWAEAVVAHLRSVPGDVTMEAESATCIDAAQVQCAGFDDQGSLEPLGALAGEAPVFAESSSGQWQCVEGHLRLNTPGASDGVLEFWVDEQWQAGRDDLDLRGTWDEYGINALVLDNHWPGGAEAPLRRWIDDVVISTEPIGCTGTPDDASSG